MSEQLKNPNCTFHFGSSVWSFRQSICINGQQCKFSKFLVLNLLLKILDALLTNFHISYLTYHGPSFVRLTIIYNY